MNEVGKPAINITRQEWSCFIFDSNTISTLGMLLIFYISAIFISFAIGFSFLFANSIVSVSGLTGTIFLIIMFSIWYHHRHKSGTVEINRSKRLVRVQLQGKEPVEVPFSKITSVRLSCRMPRNTYNLYFNTQGGLKTHYLFEGTTFESDPTNYIHRLFKSVLFIFVRTKHSFVVKRIYGSELEGLDDEEKCDICSRVMEGYIYRCPGCGAHYCLECNLKLLREGRACPACRAEIKTPMD
ncbi:MAG: hypothetical protein ACFFCS_15735 [Candidatus Hodarchaeota archaeon]